MDVSFLDIYKEWIKRDNSVNKGTPTINAARYLAHLLFYDVITISEKQMVAKEDVTLNMNIVSHVHYRVQSDMK